MPGRRGYLSRNPGMHADPNAAPGRRGPNSAAPLTADEKAFVRASRWNDTQDAYYDSYGGGYGGGHGGGYGGYGSGYGYKRRWWRSYEFKQIRMFTRRALAAQGAAVGGMFSLDSAGVLDGLEKWYAGIFATMAMTVGVAAVASRRAYKSYVKHRNAAQSKAAYKPAPPPVLAKPATGTPPSGTTATGAGQAAAGQGAISPPGAAPAASPAVPPAPGATAPASAPATPAPAAAVPPAQPAPVGAPAIPSAPAAGAVSGG